MKKAIHSDIPLMMLVDDNPVDLYINRRVIENYIQSTRVIAFDSGVKALNYLKVNQDIPLYLPDIIMLDIDMPETDGFKFIENYSGFPSSLRSKCSIYVVSSTFNEEEIDRIKANPYVKDFYSKPIDSHVMEEIIHSYH